MTLVDQDRLKEVNNVELAERIKSIVKESQEEVRIT